LRSIASETFTSVSAPIQYAAIKAYTEDYSDYLNLSRKILNCIATYVFDELTNVGLQCQRPQGGFYMLCDFSDVIMASNEISNSSSLVNKILKDTGFAMLPGSDFGINENHLITRIAFVDFDGKQALDLAKKHSHLSKDFLKIACSNIVNGINELKYWISNNLS